MSVSPPPRRGPRDPLPRDAADRSPHAVRPGRSPDPRTFVIMDPNRPVDDLVRTFEQVNRDLKHLEYQKKYLQEQLHAAMNGQNTNHLRSPYFDISRTEHTRETMRKADMVGRFGAQFWADNANRTQYWTLRVVPRT